LLRERIEEREMLMSMTFNITQIASELNVHNYTSKDEDERVGCRRSIRFTLAPVENDHFDLQTGEVFQSKRRAKRYNQEDKQISAQLTVLENRGDLDTDDVRETNSLRYAKSVLFAFYYLGGREFDALYTSIISGLSPRRIGFTLDDDTLDYGWEPDGSGQKWDNEKKKIILIERLEFSFDHFGKNDDEYEDDLEFIGETSKSLTDTRSSYSDLAKVSYVVIQKLSSLQKQISIITWIVFLLGLVIWWLK
jgi:hypothetical protein